MDKNVQLNDIYSLDTDPDLKRFDDTIEYRIEESWRRTVNALRSVGCKDVAIWRRKFMMVLETLTKHIKEANAMYFDTKEEVAEYKRKIRVPSEIPESIVCRIALECFECRAVMMSQDEISKDERNSRSRGSEYLPAIWDADTGLYITESNYFASVYDKISLVTKKTRAQKGVELMAFVKSEAPIVVRTGGSDGEENLIPVANGVLDAESGQLLPYSPEFVFLWKSPISYNPNAVSPVITLEKPDGTPYRFEFENWLKELVGGIDEDVVFFKQLIGAALRPYLKTNKMIIMTDCGLGNTGKSTIQELIINLIGMTNTEMMQLEALARKADLFALQNLAEAGKVLVMCDDADVNGFVENCGTLKSLVSGDPVDANRKFNTKVNLKWKGTMIFSMNSLPLFKDKTNGINRRLLAYQFKKRFQEGVDEIKDIKGKALRNEEVLQYILKAVTVDLPCFESFIQTENTREANDKIFMANSKVAPFMEEFFGADGPVFDRVPLEWMYRAYEEFQRTRGEQIIKYDSFKDSVKKYIEDLRSDSGWAFIDARVRLDKDTYNMIWTGYTPENHVLGDRGCAIWPALETVNIVEWSQYAKDPMRLYIRPDRGQYAGCLKRVK